MNSRRFEGLIYKEDNVQGDRGVRDYINDNALMQLLESDRIEEKIRNMEIDLGIISLEIRNLYKIKNPLNLEGFLFLCIYNFKL